MIVRSVLALGTALTLLMASACSTSTGLHDEVVRVSPFGSVWAGTTFLDRHRSDRQPSQSLSEPGTLPGHWLSSKELHRLEVKLAADNDLIALGCRFFREDCFVVEVAGSRARLPFIASYGSFLLYGIDVDGDGQDEIFLEYGLGRGTAVHEKHLSVFQFVDSRPEPRDLLHVQLTGYLYEKEFRGEPSAWLRRYALLAPRGGAVDVLVWLLPFPRPAGFDPDEETRRVLESPTLKYRYRGDLGRYDLAKAKRVPLP